MDEPLISVIVPVYRTELYLRRCINSILAQDHPNLELILVDDGSPDDCPNICDSFTESDPRVRVLHQENSGLSAARNAGLDIARGDYIAFADSDDWVDPDYLSYLLHLSEAGGSPIVACNHYVTVNGRDIAKFPVEHKIMRLSKKAAYDNMLYHQPPDVSAWGKLYARSMFDHIRYPKGRIFEDTWIIADLLDTADTLAYGAEPKYHYVYRNDALSKNPSNKRIWDFMDAVDHLTYVILRSYPDLIQGCIRRRVHAALSIRRLLVQADVSAVGDIERCNSIIQSNAIDVFRDRRAPFRDKAGILLSLAGRRLFDNLWILYGKIRCKY